MRLSLKTKTFLNSTLSILLAFGWTLSLAIQPASATPLETAQAALAAGQQEVLDSQAALASASAALQVASESLAVAQAAYDDPSNSTTTQATTQTVTQNVVQNGTFDSTAGWSNVMASNTVYGTGATPLIYNGTLKGSYTSGIYIQQTGTFPAPTRQVQFSVDVWNLDTNEGNRMYNPDYYRIEFRTYSANGTRLNYYNLEWSQWHDWISRGATYTLDEDAARWDIGFRMSDAGFWAGAFGPAMDNVVLNATMTTGTPATTVIDPAVVQALQSATVTYNQAVMNLSAAQTRYDNAVAAIPALQQAVVDATPRLNAPTNLVATLTEAGVQLSWDAPTSNASGVVTELYAINWSTTNWQDNGWGWTHDQTSVFIPLEILNSYGGLGSTFQFSIRADNNTLQVYSPVSNVATVLTTAPTPEPTSTPTPEPTSSPEPQPTTSPTESQTVPTPEPSATEQPSPSPEPEPTPTIAAPFIPQGAIVLSEGETYILTAPQGQRIATIIGYYGDPNNSFNGLEVSNILTDLFVGETSARIEAINEVFSDPAPGTVKILIFLVTYEDIVLTQEEIEALERAERERQERLAAEAAAQAAAEAAATEAARLEAERIAAEQAAQAAAAEAARLEAERIAAEQAAAAEAARLEAERLEAERLEAERIAELERAERERQERLAAEEAARLEAERVAAEQAAEAARIEAERIAAEQAAEAARLEAERIEAERLAAEAAAAAEAARLEAERLEEERLAAEEKARQEAEANKPTPTPSETKEPEPTPTKEPEPTEEPKPTPTPEPTKEPTPTEEPVVVEIAEPITAENIEALVEELTTVAPQDLTQEQQTLIVEAALEVFASAEQGSEEYEAALDALLVVAQADDIVIDEELASAPVVGAAVVAVADALNALGNAGADMSPQVREQSEKVVIAAVIVGQVAMTATAAATSAAASAARRP